VIPGTDVLVLNGPFFSSATVHLAGGETLVINGAGAGAGAPYVQSLAVDGTPTSRTWLRFADLSGGATLDYVMGAAPNESWGAGAADLPPSFAP
jgi:putative alpha-1,2-mannosidase